MISRTPSSRFILFTLTALLLLLLTLSAPSFASEPAGDDDLDGIEELLAVDSELEQETPEDASAKLSEAELLTRAQRIVLELNAESYRKVIEKNDYVLLLGYAPWCHRSAELMPRFLVFTFFFFFFFHKRSKLGRYNIWRMFIGCIIVDVELNVPRRQLTKPTDGRIDGGTNAYKRLQNLDQIVQI